jgi:hypothetical protein
MPSVDGDWYIGLAHSAFGGVKRFGKFDERKKKKSESCWIAQTAFLYSSPLLSWYFIRK